MTKKKLSEAYSPEIRENVLIDGITLKSALAGEKVELTTKGALSSYDYDFQHFFDSVLQHFIAHPFLHQLNQLLIHIKSDNTAYIYRDFPLALRVRIIGPKESGHVVFQNEINDIESVTFEDDIAFFDFENGDEIVYLFRSRWSFGLYFNLTKTDELATVERELGYFHKILDYYEVYNFLDRSPFRTKFEADGWFPFAGLIRFDSMKFLVSYYQGNQANPADLEVLRTSFNADLIKKCTDTWWSSQVFSEKRELLQVGVDSYLKGDNAGYISCIKVLVSEIEGILRFAYPQTKGRKIQPFLKELGAQGVSKYDSIRTLMFPSDFVSYIERSIFEDFDPDSSSAPASRHPITHGVTEVSKYTWQRALQMILTIDQLRFLM